MPDYPKQEEMTLSRFIAELTEEMEKDNLQNKPIVFNTSDRHDLHWLSIYEEDGVVNIDIGEEDE